MIKFSILFFLFDSKFRKFTVGVKIRFPYRNVYWPYRTLKKKMPRKRIAPTQLFLLLIVASSASVRRLFMLFYSPSPSIVSALIASLLASFALVPIVSALLVDCFCSSCLLTL